MSSILEGKSVLVVDDEPFLRDIIATELNFRGCKTMEAPCGSLAFELLKTHFFDAVVTDIRMPNGNGMELLEMIRSRHHRTPVVLLVSGFSDVSEADAFQRGADAFTCKPFELDGLMATIERALTEESKKWATGRIRIPTVLDVRLSLDNCKGSQEGKVLNIGRGGMFIALTEGIPQKGAKVSFDIAFSGGIPIRIEGKGVVRWSRAVAEADRPAGFGLEFLELSDSSISQIKAVVDAEKIKAFIPID